MRLDEKFNVKGAKPVEVCIPDIRAGDWLDLGVEIEFQSLPSSDHRKLRIHMTPKEAFDLGIRLMQTSRSYTD